MAGDTYNEEQKLPSAEEVDAKFGAPVTNGPADDFDRRTVSRQAVTPVTEHREEMEAASEPAPKPAAKKPTRVKK